MAAAVHMGEATDVTHAHSDVARAGTGELIASQTGLPCEQLDYRFSKAVLRSQDILACR
jgi:hypothetical protein